MSLKIAFLFPSKSRPTKFFATLDNLKENCTTDNSEIICVLEKTDATMNNQSVLEKISLYPNVKPYFIESTGKIQAINAGLQFIPPDYDILVLIADDICFTMKGFDWEIICDMQKYFPGLDGCIFYPDGQVSDKQITVPILGRELLNRFGYLYHPSYVSVWCDNEMLAVYKSIGKVKYIPTDLHTHYHPAWGKSENDDLYRYNESFYQTDSENYFKRLAINFDL